MDVVGDESRVAAEDRRKGPVDRPEERVDRAVALAKQRAKISQDTEVELLIYPPKKSFYDIVRDPFGSGDRAGTLASLLGFGNPKALQALAAPLQVFRRGEPLALMPNVFVR